MSIAENKSRQGKTSKSMTTCFDNYDTGTTLRRFEAYLQSDSDVKLDGYDESFGSEAGRIIRSEKSRLTTEELMTLSGMIDRLVEWYAPNEAQAYASRQELKDELERRLGGEYDTAVQCCINQLTLEQDDYEKKLRKKDECFEDEILAPIIDVEITPELSDAELAALAIAYYNRHDIASSFGDLYDAKAATFCRQQIAQLYAALISKEQAATDPCRKADYLAIMAKLGSIVPNNNLGLTYDQIRYPYERMREMKTTSPEVEALLMEVETASLYGIEDDEWQRLIDIADRWVAGYAANQWSDLNATTHLARAAVLTILSTNLEQESNKRTEYRRIAETITKSVAAKVPYTSTRPLSTTSYCSASTNTGAECSPSDYGDSLKVGLSCVPPSDCEVFTNIGAEYPSADCSDVYQRLLVRLYSTAEQLHAVSSGFFTGTSQWRDIMHNTAVALDTLGTNAFGTSALTAHALTASESAWTAKIADLVGY